MATMILAKVCYFIMGILLGIFITNKMSKKTILVPKNIKEIEELIQPFHYEVDKDYILELRWEIFDFIQEVQTNPLECSFKRRYKWWYVGDYRFDLDSLNLYKDKLNYYSNRIELTLLEKEIFKKHFEAWESIYDEYMQSLKNITDNVVIKEKMKITNSIKI